MYKHISSDLRYNIHVKASWPDNKWQHSSADILGPSHIGGVCPAKPKLTASSTLNASAECQYTVSQLESFMLATLRNCNVNVASYCHHKQSQLCTSKWLVWYYNCDNIALQVCALASGIENYDLYLPQLLKLWFISAPVIENCDLYLPQILKLSAPGIENCAFICHRCSSIMLCWAINN